MFLFMGQYMLICFVQNWLKSRNGLSERKVVIMSFGQLVIPFCRKYITYGHAVGTALSDIRHILVTDFRVTDFVVKMMFRAHALRFYAHLGQN